MGPDYGPRTRHVRPDGSPLYINRLILEGSPYLIQHAHNPVNWFAWGPEAFARAQRENKPIFLSIGFSTCHWYHVMERESFEDDDVARALNERFVAITIDRERRPDVDGVYMASLQLMGSGRGWPLSMMLTPDGKPFFGRTYFPRDLPRLTRRRRGAVQPPEESVRRGEPLQTFLIPTELTSPMTAMVSRWVPSSNRRLRS